MKLINGERVQNVQFHEPLMRTKGSRTAAGKNGLINAVNWLIGWYGVRCTGSAQRAATCLMKRCPEAYLMRRCECGIEFRVPLASRRQLCRLAEEYGLCLEFDGGHGLLSWVRRYRRRVGMLVGAMLFFVLVYLSGAVVWNIELEDSGNVPRDVILERLGEMGLRVGAFIPSMNLDEMCNRYVMLYDDLAWISVNMFGSTAKIEVREELHRGESTKSTAPSSLVAERDGQVAYFNVTSGTPVVSVNDAVVKGQPLVSGIVEYKDGTVKLLPSSGEVYAYTRRTAEVFIPFEYTKRTPSGESESRRMLSIFGLNIKLYINEMNFNEKYDRIIEVKRASLPSDTPLPISLTTVSYTEYAEETVRLSEDAAKALAEKRLGETISEATSDCELLERNVTGEFTDGGYLIRCELYCLEDIASEIPLTK